MPRNKVPSLPKDIPWITKDGYIDMARLPIDNLLSKALSSDYEKFRDACRVLSSMCYSGRSEAGVFLLGLIWHYSDDYRRLTDIADALKVFERPETVQALAAELRRVKGSSATRHYLRTIIAILGGFPDELASKTILDLCFDPQVGPRFRQHLKEIAGLGADDHW